MEAVAIELFTRFSELTVLYRATDGEYFTELDDCQRYVANNLVTGGYTLVNRTTPLPPSPSPIEENQPIWVYVAQPTVAGGLRYDGVVSSTNDNVGTLGNVAHVTNAIGAFRVNNYVMATVRSGSGVGQSKYGQIVGIAGNVFTINFMTFTGSGDTESADWEISLSGAQGMQGIQGGKGDNGGVYPAMGALTSQNLWWKLDYKLDEYDATSNGNHLVVEVDGFIADNLAFKMNGIYLQEDGEWNYTRTTMQFDKSQVDVQVALQVDNLQQVYLRIYSSKAGIRATCKAYKETGLLTNKMVDAVIECRNTAPSNIVSNCMPIVNYLAINSYSLRNLQKISVDFFTIIKEDYEMNFPIEIYLTGGATKVITADATLELKRELRIINQTAVSGIGILPQLNLPSGHTFLKGSANLKTIPIDGSVTFSRVGDTTWIYY